MNDKPPALHLHSSGNYFCKWGGRFHYFGKSKKDAQARYLESLQEWSQWRAHRNTTRFPPMSRAKLVIDIAERFLEYKALEGGDNRRRHYANHLRRFLHGFGHMRADQIKASHLHALKEEMMKGETPYSPKTINHDLSAVKSLFLWASGVDLVPAVNLRFVHSIRLPPTPDKALPLLEVHAMLDRALEKNAKLEPWLAANYLAMMRPSEVPKVVGGRGVWEEPWLFRLHEGKTDRRSEEFRRIVFSDEALAWLEMCRPHWSREDSYYRATARAGIVGGPHPLRHSGATHLAQLGADRQGIDLLLGHLPPRVSRTYAQIDWRSLRGLAALLTLRCDDIQNPF